MITDCIKTRNLLIVDESDRVRIALSSLEGAETAVEMYDKEGKIALKMLVMDCGLEE